ncbi:TPA: BapA prefix-like domain-containing protein, partial [Pseudomonas aeruginosa]|nr:BapA prefix-like domain-containing protein [Pseudomonas aeruginosa]
MARATVYDRNTGNVIREVESNSIVLNGASIVKLQASPGAFASYSLKDGNLVLRLKSGEEIVIKNFSGGELVVEENGKLWQAKVVDGAPTMSFVSLNTIDDLNGEHQSSDSSTPYWLLALLGVGGAAIAISNHDSGGSGGNGQGVVPSAPSDIAIDPNTGKLSAQGKPGAKLVVKDQ